MDPERYEVQRIFITKEGRWEPRAISPEPGANPEIDVVFPVLHGTFGEDGTVQGLLELADLPYVGAGVLASSVSMDKEVMKRLMVERGLPVVEYLVVRRGRFQAEEVCGRLPFPVFVKPANLGSSVGISKAKTCEELLARSGIRGAVRSQDSGRARHQRARVRVFRAGQRGSGRRGPVRDFAFARVLRLRRQISAECRGNRRARRSDAGADRGSAAPGGRMLSCGRLRGHGARRLSDGGATGKFYINEINTIPGFTSISMYPKMWEASGLPYAKLIDRLIELALERHRAKRETRYSR